jgi:hypothetical protein
MKKSLIRECVRIAREKNNPDTHPEWGNCHHFTFVIQRGKIVEYGMNRAGPPPVGLGYNTEFGKIHSEIDAMRKAKGILDPNSPVDIVNIRLNKQSELRLSKPCRCCAGFLELLDVRYVHFSTDIGFARLRIGDS